MPSGTGRIRVGADIGGTFTDLVMIDESGGVVRKKVPSTTGDYGQAIIGALESALEDARRAPADIAAIVHGTTVATNAILEEKGALCGLITTRGFRDVLELRRLRMPQLYRLDWKKPPVLVRRRHRIEVTERIAADGTILTPLERAEVLAAGRLLADAGVEAIAVALLNSYVNPVHEEEIARILRREFPDLPVSVSSEILPEIQEYERTSTTVVNSYVQPVVKRYLQNLRRTLDADGVTAPLLIMPHGGPFGIRDSWGFNPEVQFFANRGYAVFQVNYRGSGGYGRTFEYAGYQEWGGKMQDDLTDAVKWAVAQGLADPQRIGIIGASYGGYAALAGVTMTPELYKVGVNYVGVSDLRLITRYDLRTDAASLAYFSKAVGRDPALLSARSPVDHVEKIQVPTLHAYGRNDPRVEFSHWEVLEKALKKHGKTYEILIENREGHGFAKQETAFKYYGTVEAFLAKYLPAREGGSVRLEQMKVLEMPDKSR